MLLLVSPSVAKEIRDTIYTTDGDRIILTYDLTQSSNQVSIQFIDQQKKLGILNAGKYKEKELSKIAVMFFDRTGNYGNEINITGMTPEAFMVPSGAKYKSSQEGFYLIQSNPKLSFTVDSEVQLTIPIYLAHKPKKGKYTLFSKSRDLKITLLPKNHSSVKSGSSSQLTITSTNDLEDDNSDLIKVVESVNLAKRLIEETSRLPFSSEVEDELLFLRQKKHEISSSDLVSDISDVIRLYESKKAMLEQNAESLSREEELKSQRELEAKNDSIANAQQLAEQKEKKRSLWMILGGILLAILAFVGNQVFQELRDRRNQRNIMKMQQSIEANAKSEVKRQTRKAIHKQVKDIKINGKTKNLSI